ncbi:hypothetical protein [Pseudomonas sp. AF76]|uniref:hypothetical protein n=1 Tax=Pseudomonas sp. AF76 TaxID=554393 RepID=UPI0011CE543D|nr:hypothetical protein [Pseudomonas sp. AF76]
MKYIRKSASGPDVRPRRTSKNCSDLEMLSPHQVYELAQRIAANADQLIEDHVASLKRHATDVSTMPKAPAKNPNERRGRPAKRICNPFFNLIGPTTIHGRYPYFAQEIMEGVARLDWHDRPIGKGGSSKPLSVRRLMLILESLEDVNAKDVAEVIGTQVRQAQRYVKAIELAMPFLMKSRPARLIFDMDLPQDEVANSEYQRKLNESNTWADDDLTPPSYEDLKKLRQDLGEDAFDPDHVIYAAYLKKPHKSIPTPFLIDDTNREPHSTRAGVYQAVA